MQVLKSVNLQSGVIFCIHEGEKTIMNIKYDGKPKIINACGDCVNVVKSSSICEVIE